jgi:hypothetical protein
VRSAISEFHGWFLTYSRYLTSESDPSKGDMNEYESALKNAGCGLATLTYVKKLVNKIAY